MTVISSKNSCQHHKKRQQRPGGRRDELEAFRRGTPHERGSGRHCCFVRRRGLRQGVADERRLV